jgi:ribonuclease BN (tRNA processing enzyme)
LTTHLIPLGTNGFIPSFGRQTMSFLLVDGARALLLDAGSGVGRLLEPAVARALEPCARLEILLTHYHLDHVVGLSYLPGVWRGRAVRLWCPAPPLVDAPPEEALDRLFSPPLFPLRLRELPLGVEVEPFGSPELEIDGWSLRFRRQIHPGGSVAVRVDDRLAYVTDTAVDDENAVFARGVDLLLHEAWLSDAQAVDVDLRTQGHTPAGGVARVARAAGCRRVMTIHHHPARTDAEVGELARGIARLAGIPVEAAVEGRAYPLD